MSAEKKRMEKKQQIVFENEGKKKTLIERQMMNY